MVWCELTTKDSMACLRVLTLPLVLPFCQSGGCGMVIALRVSENNNLNT